jgi:hypothetical protein
MPQLSIYPTAVLAGSSFTTAALANVLGNTTAEAVHTGAVGSGLGMFGRFRFDPSALPAGATLNGITVNVTARASAASRRSTYSIGANRGGVGAILVSSPNYALTTTLAQYSMSLTGAALASAGWTGDALRASAANGEWTFTFTSSSATSTSTYWQKFWLVIDYTLPPGVPNLLFMNESL